METKKCKKCSKTKDLSDFYTSFTNKDGKSGSCKKCTSIYVKNYHEVKKSDPEYIGRRNEYRKKYERENPDKIRIWNQRRNNEKKKEYIREFHKKRLKTDPAYRAICNARKRVGEMLRGKIRVSKKLGCSFQDFKKHIESRFKTGMSWENYGEWEIDHIFPLSLAQKEGIDSFVKACHYTNLQPLWKHENRIKGNRLT